MTKPKLTVLKGGLSSGINDKAKHFVSAYVTDTRLMGVLAIVARWEVEEDERDLANRDPDEPYGDLYQFFYIDCEEAGLETYQSQRESRFLDVRMTEQALVGGLGAQKIDLTERALRGLLHHYKEFNERHGLPLPKNRDEYGFLFEPEVELSKEEWRELMAAICGKITSDYQAVNYFLMRCFGQDYEGALYLTASYQNPPEEAGPLKNDFPLDLYSEYIKTTFCRNVIDENKRYGDGAVEYLCESLVEMNGEYDSLISKVVVKDLCIIGFERLSGFHVSQIEAAMMLGKSEYINVYEIMLSDREINENLDEFALGFRTIMSRHRNGRLFMAFKSNNDHVSSREFLLSNDVKGLYYLTDFGQLILAAYNINDIHQLERKLSISPLAPYLTATGRYHFKEPLLYEFIESEFEDFEDFLNLLDED